MSAKLLVIGQLPPPVHGSNIMTERFVQSLRKIGYQVFLVQKTFSRRQEEVGRFSIIKIFRIPSITLRLLQQIMIERPDLCFYFISVKPPSFFIDAFFLFIIKLLEIDYVLYIHGRGLLKLCTESRLFARFIAKKTLSNSLGGLILGERLKNDVDRFIPDKRLFVLPNAIPDVNFSRFNLKSNLQRPIRILFLSNLIPTKGPMEFVQMAKKVVDQFKNVKFILAGPVRSKTFFKKIEDYIAEERLADFIEIPGPLYGPQKERYFRESDIFVFPSWFEAFPLVNLEAMQWGLPVISSNVGAIPEMVRDGVNGFIVDPKNIDQLAESVFRLINDEELRRKMGEASRKIYENYYTIEIYEQNLERAVNFFFRLKNGYS